MMTLEARDMRRNAYDTVPYTDVSACWCTSGLLRCRAPENFVWFCGDNGIWDRVD